MEVYKRPGSPYWYVTTTDPRGRRVRKSTGEKDKRAAQKAAARLVETVDAAKQLEKDGKRAISLADALGQYTDHLRLAKRASVDGVELTARKIVGGLKAGDRWHLDGAMWLHDLTPRHIEDLRRARMREGNGPVTIAHELRTLRAATYYARELGDQRIPDIRKWRIPEIEPKTRYLSWDEFMTVYRALDPDAAIVQHSKHGKRVEYVPGDGKLRRQRQDAQDLLVALALCGGRWGEVSRLTWDRVDLEAGMIRLWGRKTQAERLTALPDALRGVLQRRKAEAATTTPIIFPNHLGGLRSGSCRAIIRAMESCGLNREDIVAAHGKATVHSLRHTYASWLIQNGADLPEVQASLGHTTPAMTLRYAHLHKAKTVSKLGGIIDGLTGGLGAMKPGVEAAA